MVQESQIISGMCDKDSFGLFQERLSPMLFRVSKLFLFCLLEGNSYYAEA